MIHMITLIKKINIICMQVLSKKQSKRVRNRKYPHRSSRKGYVGLEEEEV